MLPKHRTLLAGISIWLMLPIVAIARPTMQYSGTDIAGNAIEIPAAHKPTLLVFVRPDQLQSRQAMQQLRTVLNGAVDVQVIVVVSGRETDDDIRFQGITVEDWPIVLDPDYSLSGSAAVHVWPTTVLLTTDGEQAAHLPGVGTSFASDLRARLDHAAGRIDEVELQERLSTRRVVTENHVAIRHLQLAQQLLEKGHSEQARGELEQALAMLPEDPKAQLAAARLLLAVGQTAAAVEMLDRVDRSAVPPWQVNLLRARAAIASEQWDQAETLLPEAIKLNPHPAEAHYLDGVVHAQRGRWQEAAESFRTAYESAEATQRIRQP